MFCCFVFILNPNYFDCKSSCTQLYEINLNFHCSLLLVIHSFTYLFIYLLPYLLSSSLNNTSIHFQTQFALQLEQKKGKPLKQVIGTQYRLPGSPATRCEFCYNTEKHIKVILLIITKCYIRLFLLVN